jgi:hypothetical protein
MRCQKCLEIHLGNPHQTIDPVSDEHPLLDPTPHAARRSANTIGDLLDCVEFSRGSRSVSLHNQHLCLLTADTAA